jgi:hypothetical protein
VYGSWCVAASLLFLLAHRHANVVRCWALQQSELFEFVRLFRVHVHPLLSA